MTRRPLSDVIDDDDYWRRRSAIKNAYRNSDIETLIVGLTDPDHRALAASSIGKLRAPQARPQLELLLSASDGGVRAAGAIALGKVGDKQALAKLVELAKYDSENFVRTWAIGAIRDIGDDEPIPALISLLDDPDSQIRRCAIVALRRVGDARVLPDLVRTHRRGEPFRLRLSYVRAKLTLRYRGLK